MPKKTVQILFELLFFALVIQAVWAPMGSASESTSVQGYNVETQWGPTGIGVASDTVRMSVDLLSGSCIGTLNGKGDIIAYNETSGLYFLSGTGYWTLSFSGSYNGGMLETGTGSIYGSITGSYEESSLNIGVTGSYNLAVDAASGIMGIEMNLIYSNKPSALDYNTYMVRYLRFTPIPTIGGIDLQVFPETASVSKPGIFPIQIKSTVTDSLGNALPGKRIDFEVSIDPSINLGWHFTSSDITNQNGEATTILYLDVDLSQLPASVGITASDPITGAGVSSIVVVSQTQGDLSISDVSSGSEQNGVWLTDVNDVHVNGRITGLDISTLDVSATVSTEDGSYVHDSRPSVDPAGYFSVPLSVYTAGAEYKISVTASDASGLTVSDTVTIKYLGPSLVKIVSVSAPEMVDPTVYDSFDVDVEVLVVSIETTSLVIDLSIDTHVDQQIVQALAGENSYIVTFNIQISQVQTVSFDDFSRESIKTLVYVPNTVSVLPIQQQPQSNGLLIIIKAETENGSSDTSTTNGPLINEVDIGAQVNIRTSLPYPENVGASNNRFDCETKQWSTLSKHSTVLSDMVSKRQTYPQWIKSLGIGIDVKWTQTGNVDFEVISSTIEVIRLPNNFAEADTSYVNQGSFTVSGVTQSTSILWGKNYEVPSGEYKVRVTYRVQYTVNGEVVEDEYQVISNDSFFVKRKRGNPCGTGDFHHQTIYEKKFGLNQGKTEFMLNNQGDVASGSFEPGASAQGAGGTLSQPSIQTVSFVPVQTQTSPITLYLDWDDPSADLDLTLIDPLGRVVTYLYGEGLVVNGIPGAVYSGTDVKPEWVKLDNTVEGEYIVSAYTVKSGGPVNAYFQVGEEVASIVVVDHVLGSGIDVDDLLTGVGSKFTPDDVVYSRIDFSNILDGDVVRWVFSGPNGYSLEESVVMMFSGEAYAYAPVDLSLYDSDLVTGAWSVSVSVNNVEVSSALFTVDSSDSFGELIPSFSFQSIVAGLLVCVWVIGKRRPGVRATQTMGTLG